MMADLAYGTAVQERAAARVNTWHWFGLALVSILAYAPFLTLPFISDDYTQIWLSRVYGPVSGWGQLAQDALYRCRATSLVLTHGIDAVFGLWPPAYFVTDLAVHILNASLVLLLGSWRVIGYRVSTAAAYVFAVLASHQEAVVWHAALPELLVFTFVLSTVLAWIHWQERRAPYAYGAALLLFALALLSKESGVAAVAFLGIIGLVQRVPFRKLVLALLPFGALSAFYAWGVYAGRDTHLHLHDGTFSLSAAWWITLPHSLLRLLWPWGVIAIAVLGVRRKFDLRLGAIAALWMAAGLAPYSFLLYMNRVPSRHTYLAGLGVALIAGAAYQALRQRDGGKALGWSAAFAAALILQNSTYLWIKKLPQFEQRAAVSERFLAYARTHPGMIRVRCYPGSAWTAKHAIDTVLGRPIDSVVDATAETGPVSPNDYCDTSPF